MIERYVALWGEQEAIQFLEACERPIKRAIRLNTLRAPAEETLSRLKGKNVRLERVPWLDTGYIADFKRISPGSLLEHMRGFYYVQGVPSMTVAEALHPQPDSLVVDMAAAPGGKTTHMAQMMNNSGVIVSIEQDKLRTASLESNIHRCGVTNSIVLRGDSRKLDQLGLAPDYILLDAPCSGEGLIALDPSRKRSKSMADIRFCATKQDALLDAAITALAPGGTLVYSTCSIAPEENEFVIDDILRRRPETKLVPMNIEFGAPAYRAPYGVELHESLTLARRFLPHKHNLEGFFICRIEKEDSS
ncbi:MAG: NOL1/NOP2/sun family putative RNA methylase [Candidatus Thorarchaeota archaeon]